MKATKQIAVVYDTSEARQDAIGFCDGLVGRFWEQFEFDISWWPLERLESGASVNDAATKAAAADIVVFATENSQIRPGFQDWIELWLAKREEHEGALVSLASAGPGGETGAPMMPCFLRGVAHRAGMDYLTGIPECLSDPIPETLESCAERAQQVTALLDEILHAPLPEAPVSLRQ